MTRICCLIREALQQALVIGAKLQVGAKTETTRCAVAKVEGELKQGAAASKCLALRVGPGLQAKAMCRAPVVLASVANSVWCGIRHVPLRQTATSLILCCARDSTFDYQHLKGRLACSQ